jgi:hypothetical protein
MGGPCGGRADMDMEEEEEEEEELYREEARSDGQPSLLLDVLLTIVFIAARIATRFCNLVSSVTMQLCIVCDV